jgi:hypothetical protein
MFELMDSYSQSAVIKVIGVGGGGGNAVAHMVQAGLEGVEFICINTDAQALKHGKVRTALQIGCNITKGLGAGADPEVGRQAAMEDRDRIIELIEGCDMLFITAGMGCWPCWVAARLCSTPSRPRTPFCRVPFRASPNSSPDRASSMSTSRTCVPSCRKPAWP